MAERKFDYSAVAGICQKMNTINNDIATILTDIDKEVEARVDVCDEAIYGDLGKQMLLDWDNTSANFDSFINKFNNWATLVTQAAGNYSQFESDISGFKQANPLGVTSGGITDAYTNTGYYSNTASSNDIDALLAASQYYQLTGATYIDTGMVSYLKKSDIYEGISLALDTATIVAGTVSVCKWAKTISGLTKTGSATTLTLKNGTVLDAGTNARKGIGSLRSAMNRTGNKLATSFQNTAFYNKLNGTKFGSKIASWMSAGANQVGRNQAFLRSLFVGKDEGARTILHYATLGGSKALATAGIATNAVSAGGKVLNELNSFMEYTPEYYQTGSNFATTVFGDVVNVGGQDYNFFGQSSNGINVYSDSNGNLVYESSNGVVSPVTFNNGGVVTNVTLNNMDEDIQLVAGSTNLGTFNDLYLEITEEDFVGYFDNISDNINTINNSADNSAATI